jgi:uncharacterized membrane protein YfcA
VSILEVLAIAAAGISAGAINTLVGSGTLITFPVLLAFGYAPVAANVANSVGLVPGSVSGAIGYRRELAGQTRRMMRLGACSLLGGATGAVLLLVLPGSTFKAVVPVCIVIALVMTVTQPRLKRWLNGREIELEATGTLLLPLIVFATGVYGGYFGAAQGILLLAVLGVALAQDLQRTNALKNVLVGIVDGVAAVYFAFAVHVHWAPAMIVALGSVAGAQLGARYGRRLPPQALRSLIVVVGSVAVAHLLTS